MAIFTTRIIWPFILFLTTLSTACDNSSPGAGCNDDSDCRHDRLCDSSTKTCINAGEDRIASPVDILFVVDNSPKMCDFQHQLRSSAGSLIQHLDGLGVGYSIAVTTTGPSQSHKLGQFQSVPNSSIRANDLCMYDVDVTLCPGVTSEPAYAWLSSEDPRYEASNGVDIDKIQQHLACNLTVGSDHLGFDAGLEASREALFYPGQTRFLQGGAVLALIYVSNSNDCSDARALGFVNASSCEWERERLIPVEEYVAFFKHGLDPSPKSVLAFGIIAPDNGRRYEAGERVEPVCTSAWGQGRSGYRYGELISALGGTAYNICDPPYDDAFREIANLINQAARR